MKYDGIKKRKGKTPTLGHKKSQEGIEKIRVGNLSQKRTRILAAQKNRYK